MRIVIAGGGRVGLSIAVHLSNAGHTVTLIDLENTVANVAFQSHGIVAFAGDATVPRVLSEADVAHADVLVAMLPRDADNLAVVTLARAMGARRIMVRVKELPYRELHVAAGVDGILSETDIFIGGIATAIEHEDIRTSMLVGGGAAVVFELELPPTSTVSGKTVSDVARSPSFPSSCVLAGMLRADGNVDVPRGGSVLEPGVKLLLVSARDEVAKVVAFFKS